MGKYITPNRVAAAIGFLTAIGAALVALKTSFVPGSTGAEAIAKGIVITAALAKAGAIVLKYIDGGQKWEQAVEAPATRTLVAKQAAAAPVFTSSSGVSGAWNVTNTGFTPDDAQGDDAPPEAALYPEADPTKIPPDQGDAGAAGATP